MKREPHTPGPWGATSDGEIFADDGKSVAFAAAARMTLADVESKTGPASANARLIAAAPELLAAAEEAVRRLAKGAPGWGVAKDILRAAIKTATEAPNV